MYLAITYMLVLVINVFEGDAVTKRSYSDQSIKGYVTEVRFCVTTVKIIKVEVIEVKVKLMHNTTKVDACFRLRNIKVIDQMTGKKNIDFGVKEKYLNICNLNFRGPVGGMKSARKSSKRCSDASALRGHIAEAPENITMQSAP